MGESSVAVQYLEGVRGELVTVEMDLVQYAESYYFREVRSDTSVAAVLSCVVDLVAAGERSSAPEVRNAAMMLASALGELLTLLRREYLGEVVAIRRLWPPSPGTRRRLSEEPSLASVARHPNLSRKRARTKPSATATPVE